MIASRNPAQRRALLVAATFSLAVGLAWPRVAEAQPAVGDKAVAEALFDEGKRLVDAGQAAEACPKFEESQRLDAGLGTMLYLADCYERAGRTASAWATFREAAAAAKAAGQGDREQIARARAEALEPRLHRLAVRVTDASDGLVVERVDPKTGRREPIARAAWGVALPIDPGSFRLEASAPGKAPWSTLVEVPTTAGTLTSVVPTLTPATAEPATAVPPSPPAPGPAPPPETQEGDRNRGDTQRYVGIGLLVGGGVGLGLAAVFTGVAASADGEVQDLCGEGPTCADPAGVEKSQDAVAMGNVATISLIAGGVLAATGLVVFFTAPSAEEAGASRPGSGGATFALEPAARDADVGLSLGGRF